MKAILRYLMVDLVRNRTLTLYALVLMVLSFGVLLMEPSENKGILSLLSIVLFIVPLMAIIFSTIYLYNSGEFLELLLAQPIQRSTIWTSLYIGLNGGLLTSVALGLGIPLILFAPSRAGMILLASAFVLSMVFASLAFWAAARLKDKAKGIGMAILLWFYFAVIFNALVLFCVLQFSDYPIENAMLAITLLNPIDLCRILVLLDTDYSALMGYTGALFRKFFGTGTGIFLTLMALIVWIALPFFLSLSTFRRKDN